MEFLSQRQHKNTNSQMEIKKWERLKMMVMEMLHLKSTTWRRDKIYQLKTDYATLYLLFKICSFKFWNYKNKYIICKDIILL
jgi:hypothetical protein